MSRFSCGGGRVPAEFPVLEGTSLADEMEFEAEEQMVFGASDET